MRSGTIPASKGFRWMYRTSSSKYGSSCVVGQQTTHECGQQYCSGSQQKMDVICHQRPGIAGGVRFQQHVGESFHETVSVGLIFKYRSPFNSSENNMMQRSRSVDASFARHSGHHLDKQQDQHIARNIENFPQTTRRRPSPGMSRAV